MPILPACLSRAFALGFACASFAQATPTLDAGRAHNLAVAPTAEVWAWGEGTLGTLGNDSRTNSSVPVRSGALTDIVAVAAGGDVSAALRSDGTVWVWGTGPVSTNLHPTPLPGISGATAIAAGGNHVIVLMGDGTVRAWGGNAYGQLGNGTVTDATAPVTVTGLGGVMKIAAGDEFSLALRTDGNVWAWGNATHGELGIGAVAPSACPGLDAYILRDTSTCARTPVLVPGITGVASISARGRHTLAVRNDASLWSWGSNHYGQIGDATTTNRLTPYAVPGMTSVSLVAAGFNHSVVRRSDGNLWVWGLNGSGQLGVASTSTCTSPSSFYAPACTRSPVLGAAYQGASAITAGGAHTLAVRPDGTVVSFGFNGSGQLGYGAANLTTYSNAYDPHRPLGIGSLGSGTSIGRPSTAGGLNLGTLDDGLSFGVQAVGTSSAALEIRFNNLSLFPLAIQSFRAYGNFSITGTCGAILEGESGCSLFVAFAPTIPGERKGTLVIATDSEDSATVTLLLSGTGTSASLPVNYSDIWWNPSESGWGLTVSDHETILFAVWYTYEVTGRPTWFVIPGGIFTADRRYFTGDVYSTTGPCYSAPTFNPALVRTTRVGTATLDFAPTNLPSGWARFSGTIGATSWSRNITRQPFGNASPAWGADYTDIWWNASESGWGLALSQHGNNVFGVLFTYDCDGAPLFVALPSVTFNSTTQFSGDVYTTRSSGSWWGSAGFNAADVTATRAGTASLSFTGRTASFIATVNGSTRTRAIVAQPFGHRAPGLP